MIAGPVYFSSWNVPDVRQASNAVLISSENGDDIVNWTFKKGILTIVFGTVPTLGIHIIDGYLIFEA